MKVIHFITNLGIGGAEKMLYHFLCEEKARKSKIQHIVLCFYEGIIADQLRQEGFIVQKLTGFFHQYDPLSWINLYRFLKKEKPDILHSSLWSANLFARIIGKTLSIPVICDLHSDPTFHGFLRNALDRITNYSSTHYVAVASNIATAYQKRLPSARINTIFNGVPIFPLIPLTQRTIKNTNFLDSDIIVGACGRLIPLKRYDLLLDALALIVSQDIKNIYVVLVGDGPLKEHLLQQAQKQKIEKYIFFMGQQKNMNQWYALFDVLVSCSDTEGMSMVILEALAAGCPIITNQSANADQIIEHNINGLLIAANQKTELAQTIKTLAENRELRNQLKKNAQNSIKKRFSLETSINKYLSLYQKITQKTENHRFS